MQYVEDIFRTLLTCAQGMRITMRHLLFTDNITVQYPDHKRVLPERFRGVLHADSTKCTGCTLCARACPVNCIIIEFEGKGKDRRVARFEIDISTCMWCGLCVEACRESAIETTLEYEISCYVQDDMRLKFGLGPKKEQLPAERAEPPAPQAPSSGQTGGPSTPPESPGGSAPGGQQP
ncbi:MAG: 4Fe-4S binding protein [Candidatus Riflebacteria bacterium]|nr:4Fe-4S binding protein [Candidatus Riflebacteria bacterium]